MIVSRAPVRFSLGGGGTDLPSYSREHGGFVLRQAVLGDQAREERAIDTARDIVPRGNGKKCARVVVEADGVVEARRLGGLFAEPAHALGAVVEPPGRPELQRRVDAGQRRQLARIAGFVQREGNHGEVGFGADAVEQRLQPGDIVGAGRNIETLVAAESCGDRRRMVAP